jgi:putative transposase
MDKPAHAEVARMKCLSSVRMIQAKEHPDFITVTCLEWQNLLADDRMKKIIISSLRFLVMQNRITVLAFCIMNNHIHLIWQMLGDQQRANVQRDFLKYTGQQILRKLEEVRSPVLTELRVNTSDRTFQVWERNALSIPLYSDRFFLQKLDYIHRNPVEAGLCRYAEDYYYSSAAFYNKNVINFDFLSHYNG